MVCSKFQISTVNYQRRLPVFLLAFAATIAIFASTSECLGVTLTITANNGSVTATPDKTDYSIGEVVKLVPKPDTGYNFTGWAGDAQGKRLILNLTMDSDKTITANFDTWEPPIGIPVPEFGIFETYRMYDAAANRNPALTYTQNAEGGFYTHYVDNTHPNATDSGNPYGTVERPRVSIPIDGDPRDGFDLPPGSIVEIHGGPYTPTGGGLIPGGGVNWQWHFQGSESRPIFLRGANLENKPVILNERIRFNWGEYFIIENIDFDNSALRFRTSYPKQYIAFRNLEFHDLRPLDSSGNLMGGTALSINYANNITIYNNHIHDNGEVDYGTEADVHGVGVWSDNRGGIDTYNVWVADNHIHHNGGDSLQASGQGLRNVYIGRNIMHHDRENAIDFKQIHQSIVSQNEMYGYRPCSSSDGAAIVGGHEGPSIPGVKSNWFIFNTIHDSTVGIRINDQHIVQDSYVIGNLIYDIEDTAMVTWYDERIYFINNVIYDTDRGFNASSPDNSEFHIVNNIIANANSYHIYIGKQGTADNSVVQSTLFHQGGGAINIRWYYDYYATVSALEAATGKGEGCIQADPLFVDAVNGDFRLQSTSPAIDAGTSSGVVQEVFDRFQTLYGIDIRKDIEGVSRPQGGGWDIGAYERVQGPSLLVSSTVGGSVTTPGEDYFQYDDTTDVAVEATADQYYYFVNWMGTAVDAGKVADPTAAVTTVTVDSGYTLVANFDTDMLTLTVSSTNGGSVTAPGEGSYLYDDQVAVSIQAAPAANYHFVNWTGTAVSDGKVADADSASTTVTMDGDYTLVANFAVDQRNLTTSSNSGGAVTTPGVGTYAYDHGALASVVASASANYHFVNWTGTAVDAGKVANANAASTTVTMDAAYSIQANFALDQHTLTVSSSGGGSVSTPGEGSFQYDHGTDVSVQAIVAGDNFFFVNWTGTAVNAGKVANPNSASTTVTVDAGYTIQANFGQQDGVAPTISNLSPASGSIQAPLDSLIILHVTDAGIGVDASSVQIRLQDTVVYTGDVSSYNSANGICRRTGTPADYTYAFQADQSFDYDELQTVTVNASDISGIAMDEQSYSFRTEMRSFGENKQVSVGLDNLNNAAASTACDSSGSIWAVWHAGPAGGRDIYVGILTAGANTFSTSVRLTTDAADQVNPAIALGSDGKMYVVWQDNRRGNWDIYGSTSSDGINWSAQRRIADADDQQSFNQVNPVLAVDSQSPNRAYVCWQDDRSGNYDIYIAESSDAFGTNTITQVTSDPATQNHPAIAVNSSNTVYLLWTDARNTSNGTDIYGAAGSAWTNVPVVRKAADQSNPAIAVESSGSVLHMLWVDQASGNGDIYYASSSGLPGSPLAGSNLVDDTSGAAQVLPAIAVTGTGGSLDVFACWHDERNVSGSTGDMDIYMVQADSGSGTNVFIGDGGTNSNQTEPAMGIDQSGYPYIVWTDNRGTNPGIYYAASTCAESTALVSGLIDASSGGTLGNADVQSIASVDDVSIALPAGACPYDATISVTRVENPHDSTLSFLNGYDFSPSGMEFNSPVTITLPYPVSSTPGTPTPYWYNSLTGTYSQQGIDDIEIIEINSNLHALRFTTTHLTPYYALMGASTGGSSSSTGSSGGGGGGCMMSNSHSRRGNVFEYFLPYAVLGLFMFVLKVKDRRRVRSVNL